MTCDFEVGLLKACQTHFCGTTQSPPARIVACLFHFKQALRRKMIELGIPKPLIHSLCKSNGLLELLTVIPPEDIITKGIPFIRSQLAVGKYSSNFERFWKYFESQWMKQCGPHVWNLYHLLNDPTKQEVLLNRTNNPLERFNRKLNEHFPHAHPSMPMFVETLAGIANEYVHLLENIAQGRQQPPVDYVIPIYEIPPEYSTFIPSAKTCK